MAATVQDQIAGQVLNQFHLPLGTNLVKKLEDWPTRQKIQYESMKGLMGNEFHGLKDFQQQLSMYSNSHFILKAAYSVIKSLIPNNQKILATLTTVPGMGSIGKFILSLSGFRSLFIAPQDILSNSGQLKAVIKNLQ